MSSADTPPTWYEALDNLGENLVRLGTSFRAHEEKPGGLSSDEEILTSLAPTAAKFAAAIRQTQPVLISTERHFLRMQPSLLLRTTPVAGGEEGRHTADTLVHEAILSAREIVALLSDLHRAGQTDAARTRRILEPSLHELAETTVALGWELRSVCHELSSEVELLGGTPTRLEEFGPGAAVLTQDMASAARHLRTARRGWFRLGQHLAAVARAPAVPGKPPIDRKSATSRKESVPSSSSDPWPS